MIFLPNDEAVILVVDAIIGSDSKLLPMLLKFLPFKILLLPGAMLCQMMTLAAEIGHLDTLNELLQNGCQFSMITLYPAAKSGSIRAMCLNKMDPN